MDCDDIVSCVGKAEDSPEVQRLIASLGITKKLKMPNDDIDVRHQLPKLGLSLIFKPEESKSSRLVMNGVQFISDAEQGYSSYAGTLPSQLQFSDSQAEAHAKLGPPLISKAKLRMDIWQLGELRLAIKYAKDAPNPVAVITVQVPPKE